VLAFKQLVPRLEGTNYGTNFSLWRGRDFGEHDTSTHALDRLIE
jgi:hypothetical protein